jgi:hypothetical protein
MSSSVLITGRDGLLVAQLEEQLLAQLPQMLLKTMTMKLFLI